MNHLDVVSGLAKHTAEDRGGTVADKMHFQKHLAFAAGRIPL